VQTVLVFDLGGGTLDVSILNIDSGILEVMATAGDTHLGGEDFDTQLVRHMLKLIKAKYKLDVSGNKGAVTRLRHECERAKRVLSAAHTARIELDGLADGVDVSETISRARFEELNAELLKRTLAPVRQALEDADLRKADIDEVVLVGGSTRIPKVGARRRAAGRRGRAKRRPERRRSPAGALRGRASFGVRQRPRSQSASPAWPALCTLCAACALRARCVVCSQVQGLLKEFFNGKEPNKGINPDEAVAYGAAVQAAILASVRDKVTSDLLLLDIAPLTLGLETTGGVMDKLIPRNTRIPTVKRKEYTTAHHGQTAVNNRVFEGERSMSKDNRLLGEFELSGFPKMPKGQAKIEVTFEVNADGILKVSAREKTSDTEAQITVSGAVKLSEADIARMSSDAERFAGEDEDAKRLAVNRHRLEVEAFDSLYDALDSEQISPQLSEGEKEAVRSEVALTRGWLSAHGLEATMEQIDDEWKRFTDAVRPVLEPHRPKEAGAADAGEPSDALKAEFEQALEEGADDDTLMEMLDRESLEGAEAGKDEV
jgi:molecular chaperone DnaK (HSP70)